MLLFAACPKPLKVPKDDFLLLFASAKSNQKQTKAAKRRCKIAPLWTPGEWFKTRAVGF